MSIVEGVPVQSGRTVESFKASRCSIILKILDELHHFQRQILRFVGISQHFSEPVSASDKHALKEMLELMGQNIFIILRQVNDNTISFSGNTDTTHIHPGHANTKLANYINDMEHKIQTIKNTSIRNHLQANFPKLQTNVRAYLIEMEYYV